MAFQFLKNEEATLSVKQLLFGQKVNYKIDYNTLNRMGVAEAEIVGATVEAGA